MKIILTGANGQLGKALLKKLNNYYDSNPCFEIIAPLRDKLDLRNSDFCKNYIKIHKPDFLINLAAYTSVDNAEKENDLAKQINSEAPRSFAEAIKDYGGYLIQLSTDYVFDGQNSSPYKINDIKNPLGIYGKTKLEAEIAIEENLSHKNQFSTIRTSWIISPWRKNFAKTMLTLLKENKKELKIVSDQIGCTTSVFTLTEVILKIIKYKINKKALSNYFHFSDAGVASWYDVAEAIKEISNNIGLLDSNVLIKPIFSEDYPTPCKRPNFSLLNSYNTYKELDLKPSYWKVELQKVLELINKT
tara:strand:+ start:79 stop:987 length:909 start_codon:yes stop_codon:yes gene_type:complete